MSVINQMLQELEARAGGAAEVHSLHQYVKVAPLPASRVRNNKGRVLRIAVLTGLLALIIALVVWRLVLTADGMASFLSMFRRSATPAIVLNVPVPPPASVPRQASDGPVGYPDKTEATPLSGGAPVPPATALPATEVPATALPANVVPRTEPVVQTEIDASLTPPGGRRNYPDAVPSPVAAPQDQATSAGHKSQSTSVPSKRDGAVVETRPPQVRAKIEAQGRVQTSDSGESIANANALPGVAPAPEQDPTASSRRISERARRHAILLAQRGRNEEALDLFQRALKTDPSSLLACQSLVEHLNTMNKPADAMLVLRDGMAQHPTSGRLFLMLAQRQTQQGDDIAAIETLQRRKVDAADADEGEYQATLAGLLQKTNRHREAIPHYLDALNKTPLRGALWVGLGVSLEIEKRSPEARDAFARALAAGDLSPALQELARERLARPR